MPLSSVLGQSRAVEALRAALKGKTVHHAYLFGGPEGVGKELTAVGFAQALACAEQPGEGCGQCSSCQRIGRRNHPDVTWLMPEDELVARGLAGRSDFDHTPSREIRVEQVRRLQERLSFRPLESPRKVALIASAHAMNPQAQNAFLKTLEEPPSDTVLLLVASAPDKLLPTIRSRCSKVHFGPLPGSLIAEHLRRERSLDPGTAELVATLCGGSLSRALALDVDRIARRKEVITRFEALRAGDARGWLQLAEELGESRELAEDALHVLALWNRDVAMAAGQGGAPVNRDLPELADQAAARAPLASLVRRHTLLDEALHAISVRNGSPRLQLERLLVELMRLPGARA